MPLETGITDQSTPNDLDPTSPLGSDPKSEGDDHIRNTKQVLQNFFRQLGSEDLPVGSIPAMFGGTMDESGVIVKEGGWEVEIPADFRMAFQRNPATGLNGPMVFTPVAGDSRALSISSANTVNDVLQPVDTETSTAAIAFPFVATDNVLINQFTFRGTTLVNKARLTIREDDINGKILARTATDEELKLNGFTIAATGDTVVNLSQLWTFFLGDTLFITLDRYDSGLDQIVTTGIVVKGSTILSEFIPYFERAGNKFVLNELANLTDTEVGKSQQKLISDADISVIGTATGNLGTLTIVNAPIGTYKWEVYTIVDAAGGNDARMDYIVDVNAVAVDVINDTVGRIFQRTSGDPEAFRFEGEVTTVSVANLVLAFTVTGLEALRDHNIRHVALRLTEL